MPSASIALLHAAAQKGERSRAGRDGGGAPRLQPAVRRGAPSLAHLDAGLVEQQVEQHEVGEDLAVEHRLEVELDVGLTREGRGVAQQPQRPPVGHEGPQVVVGAVEQLLDHGVGCPLGGAGDALGALVEVDAPAQEVDRRRPPQVGDREASVSRCQPAGWRGGHPAVAELAQQLEQPLLAGEADGGVAVRAASRGRSWKAAHTPVR